MAVKIGFDNTHNVIEPTLVLATRKGRKIGKIPDYNIVFKDSLNVYAELSFRVNKTDCNNTFWNQLTDFKLLWVREWNKWFELYVEIDETNDTIKNISAVSLGVAELSQINLYGIEINTENDISRDDYVPTVLYNNNNPSASLLTRIMEKAPHYVINHVDTSIANLQRTFTFDEKSLYDAFQEIAEEINCLFVIDCYSDSEGNIIREINVYDLESNCNDCGERGEFLDVCPHCGSNNILTGYGEDTTIFISTDNLADDITYTTDNGSVKNCFRLEAGDDLMTATLINCNPNGSPYIWYISDAVKEDMSQELVKKIEKYDEDYSYYQNTYPVNISGSVLTAYNNLVDKYKVYTNNYSKITSPIIGCSALMEAYYNTIDFYLYLNNSLMPSVEIAKTNATKEAAKLSNSSLSPVAVKDLDTCSSATADSSVLGVAKTIVNSRFQVKIVESTFSNNTWTGVFSVTNYADEEDTAKSNRITIRINDNYEEYVRQKIDKALRQAVDEDEITDIVQLFGLSDTSFKNEIKKYCLSRLSSFYDSCQSCIDVLVEQGIANNQTWAGSNPNLYDTLYIPYYNKLGYISAEMKLRESEIAIIAGTFDSNGGILSDGIQTLLEAERDKIHKYLDFEQYIGEDLWLEFSAYRREDVYKNDNYISDGLDNAELFENACEFISIAQKEIYKSATLQHSIKATLKNLLVMKEFAPIVDYFEVGNWLRIRVDNNIYRLRLLDYEIDFDNLNNISITFSDVTSISGGISDVNSVLNQAASMSSSYDTTMRQAKKGDTSKSWLDNWVQKGLDATNVRIVSNAENQHQTWDSHGMLFREYDPITETYDDCQLKIINSTLVVTDDNWKTIKTAVGGFYYFDPVTGKLTYAYGINAEVLIGKLILGESLGIYSENNALTFDRNGLVVTNDINSFTVNPNNNNLLVLSNEGGDILWVDDKGGLHIVGDGSQLDITMNNSVKNMSSRITANEEAITLEVNRATESETQINGRIETVSESLSSKIEQTAESITLEAARAMEKYDTSGYSITLYGYVSAFSSRYKASSYSGKYYLNQTNGYVYKSSGSSWSYVATLPLITTNLSSRITQNSSSITSEVSRATNAESSLSSRITQNANSITSKVSQGEVSTLIQQNATSVRIAWNKCSDYIEFYGGTLSVYNSSTHTSDYKLMEMKSDGAWYYRNGYTVGRIGTNSWAGNDSHKGLVFDLESSAKYMCWAQRKSSSDNYTTVLTYARANSICGEKEGIHFGCATYSDGYLYTSNNVKLSAYENGDGGLSSESGNIIISTGNNVVVYSPEKTSAYSDIDLNKCNILNQSDARLKTNISDTKINALSLLTKIELKEFDWIEDNSHEEIGIIAQQLQKYIPSLVYEDSTTGKLSIKENKFIPYIIKAIQELYSMVNQTKTISTLSFMKNDSWSDEYSDSEKEKFVHSILNLKPDRKNEYVKEPYTFKM